MKCEEAKLKLSFLPKAELSFNERQKVLNHLQACSECNKEYQEYLRMFYLIDKQVDVKVPENILKDFSSNIMGQVKNSGQNKFRINKIFWYTAAAVFIFLFLIPAFQQNETQINIIQKSDKASITELIQNEDWEIVLKKFKKNDIEDELIPVSLLLSKFNDIDRDLVNKVITKKLGSTSKDFNDLIKLLNEYQRYKSKISIIEISNYINS